MESERITVRAAASVLGISSDEIRYRMRQEMHLPEDKRTLPIGQARKSRSGRNFRYDVYRAKVMKYAGLTEWPEEGKTK